MKIRLKWKNKSIKMLQIKIILNKKMILFQLNQVHKQMINLKKELKVILNRQNRSHFQSPSFTLCYLRKPQNNKN